MDTRASMPGPPRRSFTLEGLRRWRWLPLLKRITVGRNPKRTLIRAVVLAAAMLALFKFVLLPVRIRGSSMEPAYRDASIHVVNRLAYVFGQPQRGDTVAVRTSGEHIMYLKRIVGLPGETVTIENGVVHINGRPLDEPYVAYRDPWDVAPRTLKLDEYFVIGDNRGMDQRGHIFGRAERERLVGKVLL
jgi:signal peptidase I